MDSPEQTAATPMPKKTRMRKKVIGKGTRGGKLKIFMDFYFSFIAYLVEICVSIAESLGLREPALKEHQKRVRWTCVCGCHLYDDFRELSPGAVQTLQRHLDNSDPQQDWSIRRTEPSGPHDSDSDSAPKQSEKTEIDTVQREQTGSIYDKRRNDDHNILSRKPNQAQTLWLLPFICHTGDGWEAISLSAFDVYDRGNPPDTELFIQVKQRYFKSKGRFSRFLSPRWLRDITFYSSVYPNPMVPTIGPNYLMHLWQNPHHTDSLTYQKNKSILDTARWVMRMLFDLARTDKNCAGGISENPDQALARHQSRSLGDTDQHLFRQSYVFHTLPKEFGDKPKSKGKWVGTMLMHEEFKFRYLVVLIAVLLEVTVSGLVLGVHFRYVAGLQGLGLCMRLFWISAWISGLLTLILSLWLRSSMTMKLRSSYYPRLDFFWRFCKEQFDEYLETVWDTVR